MNLDKFLKDNGLRKSDLATYLSVSNAFITQISSGARKIPEDKLALILNNSLHWDTSALTDEGIVITAHAHGAGSNTAAVSIGSDRERLASLEKENEMLKAQVDKLEAEKDRYWEMIRKLMK